MFDIAKHNKKIAKIRGDKWRKSLIQSHAKSTSNPSHLKLARVKAGFSQMKMVEQIPINTQTVYSRIEMGLQGTGKKEAEAIAKAVKRSMKSLFKKQGSKWYVRRAGH